MTVTSSISLSGLLIPGSEELYAEYNTVTATCIFYQVIISPSWGSASFHWENENINISDPIFKRSYTSWKKSVTWNFQKHSQTTNMDKLKFHHFSPFSFHHCITWLFLSVTQLCWFAWLDSVWYIWFTSSKPTFLITFLIGLATRFTSKPYYVTFPT